LSELLADTGFLLKLLQGHLGFVLFDRPPGGALVAVAGVIDQLLLGPLEPFGLALACLRQRPLCFVGLNLRRVVRARLAAYASGFGRRQIGVF
jgi:hypothetical protein